LSVVFDSNNVLASGSGDNTIKLWNKYTGDLLRTLTGHGSVVWSVAFDSINILASGSWDNTIKLWDKLTGDLLRTLYGNPKN
jgi:WD40 repeat protein